MGEAIRSAQVVTSPGVGGREMVAPLLAGGLKAAGHPAWVVCRPGTLVERQARGKGLAVHTTPMRGYLDLPRILPLARFLRRERIDVIHAHWSRDLSNLVLASGLAGGPPIVLTKHVYSTEAKRDLFHAWVYGRTAKIIAVSRVVHGNVLDTTRVPAARIVTLYNGLDTENEWNPDAVAGEDARSEWGIPAGAPLLGYVGRLNRGKGVHLVVEAFQDLAPAFPDWHLVLIGKAVGSGEETFAAGLRAQTERSSAAGRIHWVGFRTDMPRVMRTLDLLACAAEFESLGMTAVEAMAMERPVVGPDAGGIPEIIEPGRNGDLFRGGDAVDLAAKLGPLMADSPRRRRLGQGGRDTVLEKFSLTGMTRQVLEVYREVLAARRRRET